MFIELTMRDDDSEVLISVTHITAVCRKSTGDVVCVVADGDEWFVKESYAEVVAKIREATHGPELPPRIATTTAIVSPHVVPPPPTFDDLPTEATFKFKTGYWSSFTFRKINDEHIVELASNITSAISKAQRKWAVELITSEPATAPAP